MVTDHQPMTHLMEHQALSQMQSRWVRLGLLQSINPKFKQHPGKANIVVDALRRSRPRRTENQEIDQPTQRGAVKVPARVMTVQASNAQLSTEGIKCFEEAQKTDDELQEVFSHSKE